jgi:trigger factor
MAQPGVSTTVTELPESRVRVQAEVSAEEIERRVAHAARQLGRSLRVPGFRPGKAPPPVVIQRIGRDAVLDEAVRDSIGAWYAQAIDAARIHPIGEPDIDMQDGLPTEGEPLRFSIEIGVRPTAKLGDYKGLEVGRDEAAVEDEAVQAEIDQLRERSARLETAERAAGEGDFVVMDYLGKIDGEPFAGGEGRDQMIELGSGRLIPGFEEQLTGATAGEERTVKLSFPDDYGAEQLAGKDAEFEVSVKEIKAKNLPELDDDFAVDNGFDTLDELRDDIRERLAEGLRSRAEAEYREAVLDAVVGKATVTVPEPLIEARARELWDQMAHSLGHQGIDRATYLKIAGKTEEEILEEAKPDADQQLRREAVLAAVVEAEGIDPADEDLLEALTADAERSRTSPKKLLERIKSAGRLDNLKEDVAHATALDRLVEATTPIAKERAAAREKIWTPDKG